jgi:hypothetical protein
VMTARILNNGVSMLLHTLNCLAGKVGTVRSINILLAM